MLETEIKSLREEVALLRKALEQFGQNFTAPAATPVEQKKEVTPPPAPKPVEAPAPKPAATPTKEPEPAVESAAKSEAAPTVSRDDLQALCMALVRADRSKREAIQSAIAKFGAQNLVGVKDEDLAALRKELEALK